MLAQELHEERMWVLRARGLGRLACLTQLHAYYTHCPSAGNVVSLVVLTKSHSDWMEVLLPGDGSCIMSQWSVRDTAALPGIYEVWL